MGIGMGCKRVGMGCEGGCRRGMGRGSATVAQKGGGAGHLHGSGVRVELVAAYPPSKWGGMVSAAEPHCTLSIALCIGLEVGALPCRRARQAQQ